MAQERTENPYEYVSYALSFVRKRGYEYLLSIKHDRKEEMQTTIGCNMAAWVDIFTPGQHQWVRWRPVRAVGEEEGN
jgi:hypothetical protein